MEPDVLDLAIAIAIAETAAIAAIAAIATTAPRLMRMFASM
jgi:hypothetical protein